MNNSKFDYIELKKNIWGILTLVTSIGVIIALILVLIYVIPFKNKDEKKHKKNLIIGGSVIGGLIGFFGLLTMILTPLADKQNFAKLEAARAEHEEKSRIARNAKYEQLAKNEKDPRIARNYRELIQK